MHRSGTRTILSPSDLVTHLGCAHATELDRRVLAGELARPSVHDADLEVLRRRGDEHERAQLALFTEAGLSVVEITCRGSDVGDLRAAEAETLAAMRAGADVVFQATFFDGRWRGAADFLLKVARPSDLGAWSYEVADTKLARRVKPSALVQLCAYAEQVARLQGVWPEELVVITGDGEHHRSRTADVVAYHRRVKEQLESSVDGPLEPTEAVPVEHCGVCPWASRCKEGWRAADSLRLIAGVRSTAVAPLAGAGITAGAALAASADGTPVEGMRVEVVDRLRRQARLQLAQRTDGVVRHELLVPERLEDPEDRAGPLAVDPAPDQAPPAPRGLAALPTPSTGDLFFDIEGDPWVGPNGIEYLFGVVEGPTSGGALPRYTAYWGHDPAGERQAFEQLVDLVVARLDADPGMHVYHYAPYERTVLQRLAGRYGTRHAEVDRILRGKVLVDLYRVVRHAILVSQEGYGLKKLEPLYLPPDARSGEAVTDGGSSIAVYEEWLETRDPARLEEIRAYNEVDCRSTLGLRDWLEERRAELERRTGAPLPRPAGAEGAASTAVSALDARQEAAVGALLAGVPEDPAARGPDVEVQRLLADLVGWH
ncbi:MAG: TM0106 family RecB-like putative nuclease, partial [Actinomycetota bacterium]|nr:TM0106 family RecB-like putative nuclease [Actinomycetota bacterium]